MNSPELKRSDARLPNLDGFRALCICSVLFAHSTIVNNFPGDYAGVWGFLWDASLGVRFFFVISGFIITWLLLREADVKTRVNLRGFWVRRSVRILPAYSVFLVALFWIQSLTSWCLSGAGWFGVATFTSNYFDPKQWLPAHLWSLSVEEQFYLLWPFGFVWIRPWERPTLALSVLSCVAASCVMFQWIGGPVPDSPLLGERSFLRKSDSIAIGCAAAIVLRYYPLPLKNLFLHFRLLCLLIIIFLVGFPKALEALRMCPPWHFPGSTAMQAAGLASILLWSQYEPDSKFFRILQWRPLVLLGLWSYSIYLWQQLFSSDARVFGFESYPWWLSFPGWLIPTLLCGMVSYYFIEQPLRRRFRSRTRRSDSVCVTLN
jgi:peptidoglycan/LPS O-acetylase OafA/YrhL